jgi:hypothetical protein
VKAPITLCGNCDAHASGHIAKGHCGYPPTYYMVEGGDLFDDEGNVVAERVECPGGDACTHLA